MIIRCPWLAACALTCALTLSATSLAAQPGPAPPLRPVGQAQIPDLKESSGIVASRRHPGVFWSHNDSGDSARLFAFRRDGSIVSTAGNDPYRGVAIANSTNQDWEDLATDDAGNLYVADTGNNGNARTDLAIYVVTEPDPDTTDRAAATRRIAYAYPDQKAFPPPAAERNFDAEALFWADGTLWLLSKNYGNQKTRLYRFGELRDGATNVPQMVGEFEVGGMVTGADASHDGRRLAVVGFRPELLDGRLQVVGFLWVFERAPGGTFLDGTRWHRRFTAGQVEAVAWDGEDIVLTNEPGTIFSVPFESLGRVSE